MLTRAPREVVDLSEVDFSCWLSKAGEGEFLEYHRGFLTIDRMSPGSRLSTKRAVELDELANAVMRAAELGHAYLLQRCYGFGDYGYRAVARGRRRSEYSDAPSVMIP